MQKCLVRVKLSFVVFYLVIDGDKFDFWLIINKTNVILKTPYVMQ